MSKQERNAPNVGVGSLQKPDDHEYSLHEGWLMFQKELHDDSVVDSQDFCIPPVSVEGSGPYQFVIPKYRGYLNPSTLRLKGKAQIKCKKQGVWTDLPKNATAQTNPFSPTSVGFDLVDITADDAKDKTKLLDEKNILYLDAKKGVKLVPTVEQHAAKSIAQVSPVQFLIQSMWKDVELKMNGEIVTKNANLEYAYKAYIEKLLSYSPEALNTHQRAECYVPDYPYDDDAPTTYAGANIINWPNAYRDTKNFHKRRELFCNDKPFSFSMALHTEINSIPTFLLNDIEYRFTFTRNSSEFYLTSGLNNTPDVYSVEFSEMQLCGRLMIPSIEIDKKFQHWVNKTDAVFKNIRTEIKSTVINSGRTNFQYTNIFNSDQLPEQVFVFMVNDVAKNGSYEHDPFFFYHYDVEQVHLQVNNRNLPLNPLRPDWESDTGYLNTYRELYENASIKTQNIGLAITPDAFRWGTTIFGWDLNHDQCAGQHRNHSNIFGAASVILRFKKPLPHNVSLVAAAVYRDYLTIDEYRRPNVLSSFGISQLYKERDIVN